MKNLFATAALGLITLTGLTACNGLVPGPVVGATPRVSGAALDATLTYSVDTTGQLTNAKVTTKSTQPSVAFEMASGSLGFTLTGYKVTVLDSAGQQYAGAEGTYQRSGLSYRIMGGWACSSSTDGKTYTVDTTTDQCLVNGSTKVPYARTVNTIGQLPLLEDAVRLALSDQMLNIFNTGGMDCPQLKMNVSFTGYDDLNRTITPLTANSVPVTVTCNGPYKE